MIENGQRILNIGMGTLIVTCFQFIFYVGFIKTEFRFNMQIALGKLQLLSKEIFSCLIYPEYANNIYLFERRIHIQKNEFMQLFNQLQDITRYAEKTKYKESLKINNLLAKLNTLYDILLDCSLLRFRVKDHAIFKVCKEELIDIAREIDKTIFQFIQIVNKGFFFHSQVTRHQARFDITEFSKKIQKLEDNYQNVLQIAAHDPLVFFLFICSLKSLLEEMEIFYNIASHFADYSIK
jgi:hypothetical protein